MHITSGLRYLLITALTIIVVGAAFWSAGFHKDATLEIRPTIHGGSVPDGFSVWNHLNARGIQIKSITPQNNALLLKFDTPAQSHAASEVLHRALPHGYIIASESEDNHPRALAHGLFSQFRDNENHFG